MPTYQRSDIMKVTMGKLLLALVTLSMLAALSGCVVVPARGGYYYGHPHYYYRGC